MKQENYNKNKKDIFVKEMSEIELFIKLFIQMNKKGKDDILMTGCFNIIIEEMKKHKKDKMTTDELNDLKSTLIRILLLDDDLLIQNITKSQMALIGYILEGVIIKEAKKWKMKKD